MAREIQRHSTRLSQAHEAAQEFTPGQRVQTIDGHPGRVLLITGSIAPGITEYQVLLDQGGTHAYTASQLRPIPDAYAGATHPIPPGLLPAGVQVPEFRPMAAFITEDQAREAAQLHLASDDYPEMGEVLHDRPDPGAVIKVIGRRHEHGEIHAPGAPLRRLAADRYRDEDDPRDEDYNGGEEGSDIRWAQPGQQDWMHENVGPQEQVPLQEETEGLPGPIARLLQQEAAARLFYGTTINGTQIDGAGDAPQHGTIPRAEDPDGYDDQSTEGQGDDKWNEPVTGDADKHTLNGASIAMYPEGVSSGDGPGISVGPFVAALADREGLINHMFFDHGIPDAAGRSHQQLHDLHIDLHENFPRSVVSPHLHPPSDFEDPEGAWEHNPDAGGFHAFTANVPWTGEQRGHLHSWDNGSSSQAGDFVSSAQFTNKVPVTQEIEDPAQEIIEQDLRAQAALWEMPQGDDVVQHLLSHHGFYDDEIGAEGVTPEDQHTFAHAEGDPRDFQFSGVPHIHTGPWVNNPRMKGTDGPLATPEEHVRPWDRGRPMQTLSRRHVAASEHDWLAHLMQRHGYTPEHLQDLIDKGTKPSHFHEALHEAGLDDGHTHEVSYGEPFPPVPPESGGIQGGDPGDAIASSKPGYVKDPATWSDQQRKRYLSSHQAGVRVKVHGPDDFTLHQAPDEHGDDANSLDSGQDAEADIEADKNSLDYGDPQVTAPADQDDSLDAPEATPGDQPGTVPADGAAPEPNASLTGPDAETERGRALPPTAWPMTQAPVQQGGPAFTQGTHDQHGRVFPPPPPAPTPTGEDGSPIGEDGEGEPGEEGGDGKKVQLEIKTAGEDSADRMRRLYHEHLDETGAEHDRRMHAEDFEAEQGWDRQPLPGEPTMRARVRGGGHYEDTDVGRIVGTEPARVRGEDEWNDRERRVYSGSLALAHFTAAAGSAAFRFEFTASWSDVVAKAKRIRKSGRVRITHSSPGMVIGEVGGDHDVYETGIQRVAGHPQTIQHWACGCPWGSFRQDKSLPGRLNGRPCSHTMALQFEALSRTNRHRKVDQDLSAADLGVPHQVVVKSMPPWTNGGWAQTWLAPAASLHKTAAPGDADWQRPEDPRQHLHDEHGTPHEWLTGLDEEALHQRHDWHHRPSWERADTETPDPGHDHHRFGPQFDQWDEGNAEYFPDYNGGAGGHNQNMRLEPYRQEELGRTFHRYQDAMELAQETAPWGGEPGLARHLSSVAGQECYYRHAGPCPDPGRIAESLRHPRPSGFRSEITYNSLHDPDHDPDTAMPNQQATHVLNGYVGRKLAGRLHFSRSDDGQAFQVHMLHSWGGHKGVGSAMMDDLSSFAKHNGRWLDHGTRTDQGARWWASYREPYPELNPAQSHPGEGWGKYYSPLRVGIEDEVNRETARKNGVGGSYPDRPFDLMAHGDDDRDEEWAHARGLRPPAQQATAALRAMGEDPADIVALGQLAGWPVTADQTNAPWGSENVTKHPPQKPYGATEPPNPDQSPASYGFLSAPDPDNWGSIQEDSAMQMPLTSTAAAQSQVFNYTAPGHEDHGGLSVWLSHDWDDLPRCVGCGHRERHPVTGVPPRQTRESGPKAIAMELPNRQRAMRATALSDPGHKVLVPGAPAPLPAGLNYPSIVDQNDQGTFNYTDRANTAGPSTAMEPRDPNGIRMEETRRTADITGEIPQLDGALAELHDKPEPALDPDGLTAEGDKARLAAGIDGTAGDAQDVPHGFERSLADGCGGCKLCGLSPDAAVHHTASAMGDQSIAEGLTGGAQFPSPVTQEPGMGSGDEYLTPDDSSIQTIGMGAGTDSDEVTVPAGQPQGDTDSIVAAFQRSAAARLYGEDGSPASGPGDGDIAQAARTFLKTADVLPGHEAAELIAEGRGERARNLELLRLEGTHYEDEDADLARRGLSLDDFEDDVVSV